MKPIIKAENLLIPTFSFNMRAENNVIKRGAIKNIAEHSAIGIDTSPRKKK